MDTGNLCAPLTGYLDTESEKQATPADEKLSQYQAHNLANLRRVIRDSKDSRRISLWARYAPWPGVIRFR